MIIVPVVVGGSLFIAIVAGAVMLTRRRMASSKGTKKQALDEGQSRDSEKKAGRPPGLDPIQVRLDDSSLVWPAGVWGYAVHLSCIHLSIHVFVLCIEAAPCPLTRVQLGDGCNAPCGSTF